MHDHGVFEGILIVVQRVKEMQVDHLADREFVGRVDLDKHAACTDVAGIDYRVGLFDESQFDTDLDREPRVSAQVLGVYLKILAHQSVTVLNLLVFYGDNSLLWAKKQDWAR